MKKKIKSENDAFGHEIWDYYKTGKSYEIIERDDNLIEVSSGAPNYFSEYKNWNNCTKQAIKLTKGTVLDIGCGAGRHTLYLQKKGFEVIGIDNSPLAIKTSKMRGVKDARVIPIDDIGKFKNNTFDTILMLGNNFGLFGSYKKAKSLLRKMKKITKSDAIIIAEGINPYNTKNIDHLSYHKLNKKRGRMAGRLRIRVRYRRYVGDWFDYLFVSQKEMKDIVKDTGWKIDKFIQDKEQSTYLVILKKS